MERELKSTGQKYSEKHSNVICWDIWLGRRGHNKWRQGMWGGPRRWAERNMQWRKPDEGSRHQRKKIVKDSYIYGILLSVCEIHWRLESEDPRWIEVTKQITEEKIRILICCCLSWDYCVLSVCEELLALFLEIYEKQLSLYWHRTKLDVTCFLNCYDNSVGSFENFLVVVWKWAHQKRTGNAQPEQRFKWSCIFLLCCCSYSCLVLQLKRRKTMANCLFLFNCWMQAQGICSLKDIHVDLDSS